MASLRQPVNANAMSVLSVITLAAEAQLDALGTLIASADNKPAIADLNAKLSEVGANAVLLATELKNCKMQKQEAVAKLEITDGEISNLKIALGDARRALTVASDSLATANATVVSNGKKLSDDAESAKAVDAARTIEVASARANATLLAATQKEITKNKTLLEACVAEKEQAVIDSVAEALSIAEAHETERISLLTRVRASDAALVKAETEFESFKGEINGLLGEASDKLVAGETRKQELEAALGALHSLCTAKDELHATCAVEKEDLARLLRAEIDARNGETSECTRIALVAQERLSACTANVDRLTLEVAAADTAKNSVIELHADLTRQLADMEASKVLVDAEVVKIRADLEIAKDAAASHLQDVVAGGRDAEQLAALHEELVLSIRSELAECNRSAQSSKSELQGELVAALAKAEVDAGAAQQYRADAVLNAERVAGEHLISMTELQRKLEDCTATRREAENKITDLNAVKESCEQLLSDSEAAVVAKQSALDNANDASSRAMKTCTKEAEIASIAAGEALQAMRAECDATVASVRLATGAEVAASLARETDLKESVKSQLETLELKAAASAAELVSERDLVTELRRVCGEALAREEVLRSELAAQTAVAASCATHLSDCEDMKNSTTAELEIALRACHDELEVLKAAPPPPPEKYDCESARLVLADVQSRFDKTVPLKKKINASITKLELMPEEKKKFEFIIERFNSTYKTLSDYEGEIFRPIKNVICETDSKSFEKALEICRRNAAAIGLEWNALSNQFEDLCGAVRVYIRIKPRPTELTDPPTEFSELLVTGHEISLLCKGYVEKKKFGPFYGVFEGGANNKELFDGFDNPEMRGLCHSFKQVESGYSIVLFGYGLSGSGKTYSLLGNGNDAQTQGVLHIGLDSLKANIRNINLMYIFEEYYKYYNAEKCTLTGEVIVLHGKLEDSTYKGDQKCINTLERDGFDARVKAAEIDLANMKVDQITRLMRVLEFWRSGKDAVGKSVTRPKDSKGNFIGPPPRRRVSRTPNNDLSSRSHLYMVFEIEFIDDRKGYITIVDTAGRESPTEIRGLFLDLEINKQAPTLGDMFGRTWEARGFSDQLSPMVKDWENCASTSTQRYTKRKYQRFVGLTLTKKSEMALRKENSQIGKSQLILNDMDNSTIVGPFRTFDAESGFISSMGVRNKNLPPRWFKTEENPDYYSPEDIHSILVESLYINETINHLTHFFNHRTKVDVVADIVYQPPDFDRGNVYTEEKFFTDPRIHTGPPGKYLTRGNCHVIPILNFLDELGNAPKAEPILYKPTKFVLLMCVREEETKCKDSVSTLVFGDSIRST